MVSQVRGKTIQPMQLGLDDKYNNLIYVDGIVNSLTLKALNKNCSRRHFNFLLLSFEENKA